MGGDATYKRKSRQDPISKIQGADRVNFKRGDELVARSRCDAILEEFEEKKVRESEDAGGPGPMYRDDRRVLRRPESRGGEAKDRIFNIEY